MELIFFLLILNLFPFSSHLLSLCVFFFFFFQLKETPRRLEGYWAARMSVSIAWMRYSETVQALCLGLARKIQGLKAAFLLNNIAIQTPGNESYSEDISSLQMNNKLLKSSYFF